MSPAILDRFAKCEAQIKQAEITVNEFQNVIDSVKGISKKDIYSAIDAIKADVATQIANFSEKVKHADEHGLQLAQKLDKFQDD